MDYEFLIDNEQHNISITKSDEFYKIIIDDTESSVKVEQISENSMLIIKDNKITKAFVAKDKDKTYVNINGEYIELTEVDDNAGSGGAMADEDTDGIILPPMPGKVIKVLVAEGDEVKKGDGLIIVESMKMENELSAPTDGKVKKVHVAEGEQVNLDQPLIELDIPEKE